MTKEERLEFKELRAKVDKIEDKVNTILTLMKGVAIGLAIGGIVFGLLTVKDLLTVKELIMTP